MNSVPGWMCECGRRLEVEDVSARSVSCARSYRYSGDAVVAELG
jgi:hypothetical protein